MRYAFVVVLVITGASARQAQAAPSCTAPRMLVVLDKSSSMVTGKVGASTKWQVAKTALSQIAQGYEASIELGLMVFPTPNQCGGGSVKVEPKLNSAQAIIAELQVPPPSKGNWTPMAQSLAIAAGVSSLQDTAHRNYVLLITDGWQWCDPYAESSRFVPVNEVQKLKSLGIETFVVGFGDAVDTLTLNKMAVAAGTQVTAGCNASSANAKATNNCYFQASDSAQLDGVLKQIAKLVTSESCDGQDNDCNGKVDDNLSRACTSACGSGTETCQNGAWIGCTAPRPELEICDGKDNNCDGTVDEGCDCVDGATRPCGNNDVGVCKKGQQTCQGGKWSNCAGLVNPSPEQCDGLDNDCDGLVDDQMTRPCQTACGVGTEACVGGAWQQCTSPRPGTEICDGLDNDCDGEVDEPDTPLCTPPEVCDRGACRANFGPVGAVNNVAGCDCNLATDAGTPTLLLLLLALVGLCRLRRRR